jgi:protein-tyrosine phosphatase
MRGYVDLHCHYLPAVDDGVRTVDDAIALLRGLRSLGFDHVVATPHIRPSLFDNTPARLRESFAALVDRLATEDGLPTTSLAAEHYFDDVVYRLLLRKEGLAHGPKGRAVLVEFGTERMPVALPARFFDLRRNLLRPIVAHPERYDAFAQDPLGAATELRRAGGVLLLDLAALVGTYGRRAQRTAEALVEGRAYYAACSDAHRPTDVDAIGAAIERLVAIAGVDERERLLGRGPREILESRILDAFD